MTNEEREEEIVAGRVMEEFSGDRSVLRAAYAIVTDEQRARLRTMGIRSGAYAARSDPETVAFLTEIAFTSG
jgi:hypothetical protein